MHTKVPRGRHGHTQEEIGAIQRARIVDAFVCEIGERGYAGTHIANVCVRAGVSTKTFYAAFLSKDQCFYQVFELGVALVWKQGAAVFGRARGPWEHRLHGAVDTMLGVMARNVPFCRLAVVEAREAGPESRRRFDVMIDECQRALTGRWGTPSRPPAASSEREEWLVNGVVGPLARYVDEGRAERLTDLSSLVTYTIAHQVVGQERALREVGWV